MSCFLLSGFGAAQMSATPSSYKHLVRLIPGPSEINDWLMTGKAFNPKTFALLSVPFSALFKLLSEFQR